MSIKSVVRVGYIVLVVAIVVVIVTTVLAGPSRSAEIPAPINSEISSLISHQISDIEISDLDISDIEIIMPAANIAAGEIILDAIAIS